MLSSGQNYQTETRAVPARVLYEDGSEILGSILIPRLSDFTEILGSDPPFLTFTSEEGETSFIYTSKIRSICPKSQPRIKPLDARKNEPDEPYELLNVTRETNIEDIKRAYENTLKCYDPNREVSTSLPAEVVDYLKAKTHAIHQAYGTIEKTFKTETVG